MEFFAKKDNYSKSSALNISVCIVSKNDANLIENCILSIKDFAKEIIVIDLESTDTTIKIAQKYTNKIIKQKWNYDYSEVKNQFQKTAISEWLFFLDAYENLAEESKSLFGTNFLNPKNIAYIGRDIQMFQDREIEIPSGRLIKKTNEIKFKGPIFESPSEDIQRIGKVKGLGIESINLVVNSNYYLKYIDDNEMYKEYLEILNNALDKKSLDRNQRLSYLVYKSICLKYIGDLDEASELMLASLEEIKRFNKKDIYNIPLFIQAFNFLGWKYSKESKYKDALNILKEGVEFYPNSLTLLTRYSELLYANNEYKDALDNVAKIIKLQRDDSYYPLEGINFNSINKISNDIAKRAYNKYMENN